MDQVDQRLRETEKRQLERQRRVDNVSFLQQQAEVKRRAEDERHQVWKSLRAEVDDDVKRFRQEEEQKRAQVLEARHRFDEDCQRQLALVHQRKRTEHEIELKLDHDMARASRRAAQREDAKEERRREKERASAAMLAENARAMKDRREQLKRDEVQLDIAMAKKQQELSDQQEKQRDAFFEKLQAQQQRSLARYEQGDWRQVELRRQREEDERVQRQQQVRIEKEQKLQEQRDKHFEALRQADKATVQGQLEEKQQTRKLQRDADMAHSEEIRRQVEFANARDEHAEQERRQKLKEHAEYVRGQIHERSQRFPDNVTRDKMSEVERQMNRDKLVRAQDPSRPDGMCLLVKKKKNEYRHAERAEP